MTTSALVCPASHSYQIRQVDHLNVLLVCSQIILLNLMLIVATMIFPAPAVDMPWAYLVIGLAESSVLWFICKRPRNRIRLD